MFLIIESGICAVVMLFVLGYFPDAPPVLPSISENQQIEQLSKRKSIMEFFAHLKRLVINPSFMALVTVGGWQTGMLLAWQGMWQFFLVPTFSVKFVAWLGFWWAFSSAVGATAGGILCDKFFQRKFKLILILLLILEALLLLNFSFSIPSFMFPTPLFTMPEWLTVFVIVLHGFFREFLNQFGLNLEWN